MITKDINHRRGTKRNLEYQKNGDLTGHEISLVVKPSTELTDVRVIDKNIFRQGEIDIYFDSLTGRTNIIIHLLEEDTYGLQAGNYYYDLDDLSLSDTIANGIFILWPDVQTPFDNLESIPQNNPRMILLNPAEFNDDSFVYKITEDEKEKFTGISINDSKSILGITTLENFKVDKVEGKGLSENDFTNQNKINYESAYAHSILSNNPHNVTKEQAGLGNVQNIDSTNPVNINQNSNYRFVTDSEKSNWNNAYTDKHTHSNKTNLDVINQNLGTSSAVQFNQAGLGRAPFGTWSLALQAGLSIRGGNFLDWEGGNARIRENNYNFEFSNYDGSGLSITFKLGAGGNTSYKPLSTNGQVYKINSVSSSTTLSGSDHVVFVTSSSTDKTITLPVTNIPDGAVFFIKKADSGTGKVIVQSAGGSIDGQTAIEWNSQFTSYQFIKNGSNYSILSRFT